MSTADPVPEVRDGEDTMDRLQDSVGSKVAPSRESVLWGFSEKVWPEVAKLRTGNVHPKERPAQHERGGQ